MMKKAGRKLGGENARPACDKKTHAHGMEIRRDANGEAIILWCHKAPQEAYDWAKVEWMKGLSVREIATRTGFLPWKINAWIHGYGSSVAKYDRKDTKASKGWAAEKAEMDAKIQQSVFKSQRERFGVALDKTLSCMERGLDQVISENRELSVRDVNLLTSTAETLHAMMQLEQGKPTHILGRVKVTRAQVLEKLKKNDIIDWTDKPAGTTDSSDPTIN